jgi:hypothetical protein
MPRNLHLTSYTGHFQFLTIDGLWLTIVTCLLGGLGEMLPGVEGMSEEIQSRYTAKPSCSPSHRQARFPPDRLAR